MHTGGFFCPLFWGPVLDQGIITEKNRQFDNIVATVGTVSCRKNKATSDNKAVRLTIFCLQWLSNQIH